MPKRARDFPGLDTEASSRMAREVEADEQAILDAVSGLRRSRAISLETIGFMLGVRPGRISRYLHRNASVTLTDYLRIARALGYRCQFVLEKAQQDDDGTSLSRLNTVSHRVQSSLSPSEREALRRDKGAGD